MANDFTWIYLLFFLIPLARIVPRLIRKYKGKYQDESGSFPKNTPYEKGKTDTVQNTKTTTPQSNSMMVLGELNRGIKKYESIQRNTGLDSKELDSILEDLEKQGLMKVIRKQGIMGPKVELHPTNEGFKKYYS